MEDDKLGICYEIAPPQEEIPHLPSSADIFDPVRFKVALGVAVLGIATMSANKITGDTYSGEAGIALAWAGIIKGIRHGIVFWTNESDATENISS
ncbi:MAG: hypothetical protein HYV40_02220 [Candidatus Levybacteria bacterium]|nr:hypothetical protein [Candidatus Levybacteria bacterium]